MGLDIPAHPARQVHRLPLADGLYSQPLDHPAMYQVFLQDFVDIFAVNVGVPDTFRIDDDYRSCITAVKTSRRVDPYTTLACNAKQLAALLGVIAHGLCFKSPATGAAIGALIDTEKNVITVIIHRQNDTGCDRPCKPRDRTPVRNRAILLHHERT